MLLEARLRAFAAVANERSFIGAAHRLRISQPAVSKHVSSLEQELGMSLVTRRPSFQLTPAGAFLGQYLTRAESLLDQAAYGVPALAGAHTGILRVGASGTPGTYVVPAMVARYLEEHPHVEIDFRLGTSGEIIDALRHHEIEIAVVGGLGVLPDIDVEHLLDDEIVLVGAPSLASTRFTPRRLEALLWVHREEGSATRVALDSALHALGVVPRRQLSLPSWEAIKLFVADADGDAVAAISRLALDVELRAGTLTRLSVPGWRLGRPISLAYHPDIPLTPPAENFVRLLHSRSGGDPLRSSATST
jgi:DNA-binding transcriptional LysR family regulator